MSQWLLTTLVVPQQEAATSNTLEVPSLSAPLWSATHSVIPLATLQSAHSKLSFVSKASPLTPHHQSFLAVVATTMCKLPPVPPVPLPPVPLPSILNQLLQMTRVKSHLQLAATPLLAPLSQLVTPWFPTRSPMLLETLLFNSYRSPIGHCC